MARPEKVKAVADIKVRLDEAQAVFLAEYSGLSVKDQQTLRRELRANDAEFKVVKMTLARLAAAELGIDSLDELLLGPTGLTFADGDPVGAARALRDFSKGHEVFSIKGGLLGGEFLPPERIAELADVEPREVLLAQLAGAMESPMAKLAGLLAALPRNLASMMLQVLEEKEQAEASAAGAAGEDDAEAEIAAETPAAADQAPSDAGDPGGEASDAEPDRSGADGEGDEAVDVTESDDELASGPPDDDVEPDEQTTTADEAAGAEAPTATDEANGSTEGAGEASDDKDDEPADGAEGSE